MKTLYHMPFEIVGAIFIEWTMLEWFAPAVASQVCRYFKRVTNSTPRIWSKLFLSYESHAKADNVRTWLERGKAAPREMVLATRDISAIMAALESAKHATSLIYLVPAFSNSMDDEIRLPTNLPQLRQLHIDASKIDGSMVPSSIFGLYECSDITARFPCLTIMRLFYVDLSDFDIISGLFPVMRHLILYFVGGPILDLIQECKGSLEDLSVTRCHSTDQRSYPHGRICLPNLKILIILDTQNIVSDLEAPTLHLLYANLDEIDGSTRPFPSVVEWVTRKHPYRLSPVTDITTYLNNMPQLRCLMLSQDEYILHLCFKSLRDTPTMCPQLQFVEVVDFIDEPPAFRLHEGFKAVLEGCMAQRAANVAGFTLKFVGNDDQLERLEQFHPREVCLFISRVVSYLIMLLGTP